MTKDQYFELCNQLNSEPVESEIPKELSEFPLEVIQAWHIYNRLPSRVDGTSGSYLGKSLEVIPIILDLMEISTDKLLMYDIIEIINDQETEQINKKIKSSKSAE